MPPFGLCAAASLQVLQNEASCRTHERDHVAGGVAGAVLAAGAGTNAVSIQFKEFGIRLNFTPNVLSSGSIRLQVEPEVSSLDFANGLVFGGFEIPSLVTRRASTTVELRPGQHLAIAGLLVSPVSRRRRCLTGHPCMCASPRWCAHVAFGLN